MKETETKTQMKPQSKGAKVAKAVFNTIINILIVLVLVTSLLIAVMALTSKANGLSTIFGHTLQPIQSDSMLGGSPDGYEGGDYGKGDLIIGKATNADPDAEYDVGDIVTYRYIDTDGNAALVSHRIVNKYVDDDGNAWYQTWGDNREVSNVPDQADKNEYINSANIVAVNYSNDYHGKVMKNIGSIIDYLRTQQGFFFVVLLPMIIFFMYALIRVVLSATSYKKSKAEEVKDEAVKAAVAEALAAKGVSDDNNAQVAPAEDSPQMTAEEMEQFRQFQEFQKMQKAQQEQNTPEE